MNNIASRLLNSTAYAPPPPRPGIASFSPIGPVVNIDPPTSAMGQLALELAATGLHIFPCSQDKTPKEGIGWKTQATTFERTVRYWWKRWPDALPAIALGKSDLIVLDADRHGGPDGVAALGELETANDVFPNHPVVITAGGGEHHLFVQRQGEPLGNAEGGLSGKGINVRGSGGYIIAPGAQRSDGSRWKEADGTPSFIESFRAGTIPALPEWVAELIRMPSNRTDAAPKAVEATATQSNVVSARERAYAGAALKGCASELASEAEGGRNEKLNKIAFRMATMVARGWIDQGEVEAALRSACELNGLAGEGVRAVQATIRSGMRDELKKPHRDIDDRSPPDRLVTLGNTRAEVVDPITGEIVSPDPLAGFVFDGDLPIEPHDYLVKGLLPPAGVGFVGGQSGSGKTFIVVDLAVSLATGQPFFGRRVKECVGVAILAAEGVGTLPLRLEVARRQRTDIDRLAIAFLGDVPNLSSQAEIDALIPRLEAVARRLKQDHGVRLGVVIVDTLAAAFDLNDENDNTEAAKIIRLLRKIGDRLGVLVIVVHHYGKGVGTGLRGASAWRGGCDAVLSVLAERNENTGDVSDRELALAKSRLDPEGPIAPFELHFVSLGVGEDGDEFGACYVTPLLDQASKRGGSGKKRKKESTGTQAFRAAFTEAMATSAVSIRAMGNGPQVRAVRLPDVRAAFERRYPTDEPDPKKRKDSIKSAFRRALKATSHQFATYFQDGTEWIWSTTAGSPITIALKQDKAADFRDDGDERDAADES